MAGHDFVKEELQLESKTGRVSVEILGTLFGGVLLVCALIALFTFDSPHVSDLLALSAAILLGAPLVVVAVRDLWTGHMHMNELVAIAVIASLAMGRPEEAQGDKWQVSGYLEAGAIAFFMILSVLIESRTALGAQASIESLIRITPTRASKVDGDAEAEVDARDLKPGDVVRVRPGDNIPADGRIITGQSTVNQANITGESLPVDKMVGDEVFGGTINVTGVMDLEVIRAGEDTTLGKVKELIAEAESTRIPIMRMIDRYAGWYTPTVLMLVAIVWFFISQTQNAGEATQRAIAMLVVACPCALILATPTAMVAAISAASRLGVYVKSVVDLEAARNLTAMVFDKTGTLTTGELQVTRLAPAEGVDGATLLTAAASVEQNSRHPVARAVVNVARQARIKPADTVDFLETAGKGVSAKLGEQLIRVGRGNWIIEHGVAPEVAEQIRAAQSSTDAEGLSTLFVTRDGQLLGWVGLADNTRPEAAAAMDALREQGLKRLIIVTGDRESVAKRVAAQMHTEYQAEVLPHQKLEMVDALKAKGHRVAVIGDGVNDAPALKAGDVSIAMGAAGSDVAVHAATIALMNSNLNRIPFVIRLSRMTSNVIKQNMAFAVGFIVLFLALGAVGLVNPIFAALLHVVSTLVVVFNSARLVRSGEDIEHAEHEALEATIQRAKPAMA